jgi:hypothetical protein
MHFAKRQSRRWREAYKLLRQRDLVELHLVNTGRGRRRKRACREEDGRLHDDDNEAEVASELIADEKNEKKAMGGIDEWCGVFGSGSLEELWGGWGWGSGKWRMTTSSWRLNWHVHVSSRMRPSETLHPNMA